MNEFLENLKREASANPIVALGVASALMGASAKLIEAASSVKSKKAYAAKFGNSAKNASKK